jgi:SAM-dependent methyltransferase
MKTKSTMFDLVATTLTAVTQFFLFPRPEYPAGSFYACPFRSLHIHSGVMPSETDCESAHEPLTQSLDLLSDTYNYNLWVYSLLRPHIGANVLEIGAGVGNVTQFLLPHPRVVCLEPEPRYNHALQKLAAVHRNIEVVHADIQGSGAEPFRNGTFDTVLCINVLEHIKDDTEAVRHMLSCLRPDGKMLLYVPACPSAFGVLDASLGHFRRYSRSALRRITKAAGGQLLSSRFVNMPGYFGWLWASRISRDTLIKPQKARFVDRLAPYISAVERIIPPPIGQSLLAVIAK